MERNKVSLDAAVAPGVAPAVYRVAWRHVKANGSTYRMVADLCDPCAVRIASARSVLSAEPPPRPTPCTFCAGRDVVTAEPMGEVV